MANNKTNKSFEEYWNDVEEKLFTLEKNTDTNVSSTAADIKNDVKQLKEGVNGLRIATLWLLLVAILAGILAFISLTNVGGLRRFVASDYEITKDSILNLTGNNEDLTYIRVKGKIVSYAELMVENDTLESRYYQMQSELKLCQMKLENAADETAIYKEEARRKIKDDVVATSTTPTLTEESAKQIDSAFILLKAFRHKMSYDKETNMWTIQTQ